eukprot:15348465-Alexandrium_andersonii.AAC.1
MQSGVAARSERPEPLLRGRALRSQVVGARAPRSGKNSDCDSQLCSIRNAVAAVGESEGGCRLEVGQKAPLRIGAVA